jgi:hypothetical protein
MWKLAPEYGVSDVALARTCRKLQIPMPGRGYWAKLAAGKRVRSRPPLPQIPNVGPEIGVDNPDWIMPKAPGCKR